MEKNFRHLAPPLARLYNLCVTTYTQVVCVVTAAVPLGRFCQTMIETVAGHLYDYPKYYDLVFGSDRRAEFDFLRACFDKHARRPVRRVFEPASGTGQLMVRLAVAGYEVAGNDLSASTSKSPPASKPAKP